MYRFFTLLLFLSSITCAFAQKEQDPDTLILNSRRYLLLVHRDVPSVVQNYYQRTRTEIPFNHWSSNNNRGHVATFEILDNSLFLKSVEAKRFKTRLGNLWTESGIDTSASPLYFGIRSLDSDFQIDDAVLCDWFSGVVELVYLPKDKKDSKSDEAQGHRYIVVANGNIEDNILITNANRKDMEAFPSRNDLLDKNNILERQARYIEFYNRIAFDREMLSFQGHHGLFEQKPNSLNLAMEYFDNNPLSLPQNWHGNLVEGNGSIFGSYKLKDDSLFLVRLSTHSGSERYSYDSVEIDMVEYLNDTIFFLSKDGLFANWVDGEYVVQYGLWIKNDFGVTFDVDKTQKLRIKNGIVVSSRFSPRGFDEEMSLNVADTFSVCNQNVVYAVDYKMLAEAVGKLKVPKKTPEYIPGKDAMRAYFGKHPLTDPRAKERLFRVVVAFVVNCEGKPGEWRIITRGKGELAEYANMVLDVVKNMPRRWNPAIDKKGNPVDCWQVLEFTVSNGLLTSANYR